VATWPPAGCRAAERCARGHHSGAARTCWRPTESTRPSWSTAMPRQRKRHAQVADCSSDTSISRYKLLNPEHSHMSRRPNRGRSPRSVAAQLQEEPRRRGGALTTSSTNLGQDTGFGTFGSDRAPRRTSDRGRPRFRIAVAHIQRRQHPRGVRCPALQSEVVSWPPVRGGVQN
jgi:hypothetical protein